MNKKEQYLEKYQKDSTPLSDGASDLTIKGQQVFRLIAQDVNTDSQHTNPAQALRALFEGSSTAKEITFSLQENDCRQDADVKGSCTLSVRRECESVLIVCNHLATHVDSVSSGELIQTNVIDGGLLC